jgi:hypothetical protein
MSTAKVQFDTIRTLAFGSISGTYASVGSATTIRARMVCITNNTDADMYFTTDTAVDQIIVPAGSFKLWDFQSNMNNRNDDVYVLEIGTQFSVKQVSAPSSGDVYIELVY